MNARFCEKATFSSLYTNEDIYNSLGKEMCITIDIAMAMSGSEAVAESYYSVMGTQTMTGGQDNDTLVLRTNIDWCFPNSINCNETIKEVANFYLNGCEKYKIKKHQIPVFIDKRRSVQVKYNQRRKVRERLSKQEKIIFLSDKDK